MARKRKAMSFKTRFDVNELGLAQLKKWVSKHGVNDVSDAMRNSAGQYIELDPGTKLPSRESVSTAWDYVGRIAGFKKVEREKPYMRDVMYIRGILRNRFNYVKDWEAKDLLEQAIQLGADVDALKRIAKYERSYSSWVDAMDIVIQDHYEARR